MLFSSLVYIVWFLPVAIFLYFASFRRATYGKKIVLLLAASLFFYGWWLPKYLPLLIASILVNYALGKALRRVRAERWFLSVGIILNLLPLFFFKHIDIVLGNPAKAKRELLGCEHLKMGFEEFVSGMARFLNHRSQRRYRLKFADAYYGELNHYGIYWLKWVDVRK